MVSTFRCVYITVFLIVFKGSKESCAAIDSGTDELSQQDDDDFEEEDYEEQESVVPQPPPILMKT